MKILVGLGNPGEKYQGNRHNAGFMAIDAIAARYGAGPWRKRFQGIAAEIDIERTRYLLLKPGTYMNESGRAVGEAVRFYKGSPADVIVFHDEIDLDPGKVRVKFGGGHAGNNGLKSVSAHIGNDYQRVRIGVGHPGQREAVAPFLLHDFARDERELLEKIFTAIAAAVPYLVTGQDAKFMNDVTRAVRPEADRRTARQKAPPPGAPEPDAAPAPKAAEQKQPPKKKKELESAMAAADTAREPQTSLGAKLMTWLRRG